MGRGAWWAAVHGVTNSWTRLSDFTFTFHFHALEKEMAAHSSVLAWRIPGKAEPGWLPSMRSHRVGHNWSDLAAAAAVAGFKHKKHHSDLVSLVKDVNDNPICKTEKETQMYRTDFWTLWEKARVGCFKRTALKHVYYLGWNRSPAQVGCMRQVLRPGALGRPSGIG